MIVALTGLLARYYAVGFIDYNIAGLAYAIEREGLDIAGGMKDHAATFGGFNFIEFTDRGDRKTPCVSATTSVTIQPG